MLNWIYVNTETRAVSYGARKDTIDQIIGTWSWTTDERFLTLRGGHEQFVVVREEVGGSDAEEDEEDSDAGEPDRWALYWDPDGEIMARMGRKLCRPVRLQRKLLMGMESRYVGGSKES